MKCGLCESGTYCEIHDREEWEYRKYCRERENERYNEMIDNLFDVTCDNVHMVKVDEFEAAAPTPCEPKYGVMATYKQLGFLKSLFAERKNNEEAMILRQHLLSEYRAGKLTKHMASEAINDVMSIPKDITSWVEVDGDMGVEARQIAHGQVWMTKFNQYVRIKENQAGTRFYGLLWMDGSWAYTPGILRELDHLITAEEAAAWGHEHQWCVFCSKNLSDPRSEFAGYGETCARKHDLPWGATA